MAERYLNYTSLYTSYAQGIIVPLDGCACFVSAIIPDREADEVSAFAAPNKRIRQKLMVDSESGAGASAGEPDVSDDTSDEGADRFGRHVEEIPAGTSRADGTATRASRKRVVYK